MKALIYMVGTAIAVGIVAAPLAKEFPIKVIYNPTISAPKGFYFIRQKPSYVSGDIVVAMLPMSAEKLAVERRYLPPKTPVLKTVYGVSDDELCFEDGTLFVNGTAQVGIKKADSFGRQMPKLTECITLSDDDIFLLSTAIENSFDSRYFGPVVEDNILGVATPLLIFRR